MGLPRARPAVFRFRQRPFSSASPGSATIGLRVDPCDFIVGDSTRTRRLFAVSISWPSGPHERSERLQGQILRHGDLRVEFRSGNSDESGFVAIHSQSRHEFYENPLITRYASQAMGGLWSAQRIHSTWRKLWVALAEAERELGLPITQAQIDELAAAVDDIDFDVAARYERELRHDVMAHVHTYRDRCPGAGGILHLGATSAFVTDNTELILIRESLQLVRRGLVAVIDGLARFAEKYRDLPCLGLTHLQAAQPTTVGKRATLWCYDLVLDLKEVEHRLACLKFRGAKGDDRHSSRLSFALRRGPFEGRRARSARRPEDGICGVLSGHWSNLLAESRRPSLGGARRHWAIRAQSGNRFANSSKPQGDRRAV